MDRRLYKNYNRKQLQTKLLEKMEFPKENILDQWLDQNGDKEINIFVEKNLAITEKIRLALDLKGWKAQDLAKAMNKKPSEVSKWLSGLHNLTLKSIIKMETALEIDLIQTETAKQYEYIVLEVSKQTNFSTVNYEQNEELNNNIINIAI